MSAKCVTKCASAFLVKLFFISAVVDGGQLFVVNNKGVERFDSKTFEHLGDIPNSEYLCCQIDVDPYRRVFWARGEVYGLGGNLVSERNHRVSTKQDFDPISNSFWEANAWLIRGTYDRVNVTYRHEAFGLGSPSGARDVIAATEDNVFFISYKTIYSLNGPVFDLPITMHETQIRTVEDGFLYFSYSSSITDWPDIYRIRTDGTGLEELAGDIPWLGVFDVDPESEMIFYQQTHNSSGESTDALFAVGFGESTPHMMICDGCAKDLEFIADDEWFMPGDTDLDYDIDITDFNTLSSNFSPDIEQEGPTYAVKTIRQGDFNGDWRIDISDFNTLSNNFDPAGYPGPFASVAVPEPSVMILATLAAVVLIASPKLSNQS